MGLSLIVGILVDLKVNDPEGWQHYQEQFESINRVLRKHDLPDHQEPSELDEDDIWSGDMYGYSGLHYLRRIAAYLEEGLPIPPPQMQRASLDPILQRYYSQPQSSILDWIFRRNKQRAQLKPVRFAHLIYHSDCEGYYIPKRFSQVLVPESQMGIDGGPIGSSFSLMDECQQLAEALELPLELAAHDDQGWIAVESGQGIGDTKWQQYGIESFTCMQLYLACRASIETGAAIVFS